MDCVKIFSNYFPNMGGKISYNYPYEEKQSDFKLLVDKIAKENVEFMLSAVIYANEDEVLNDGKYDYKGVGLPYLAELGRQFYNYELQRIKR